MKRSHWSDEIKRSGWKQALLSRLIFHNGLYVGDVADCGGVSLQTARKHVRRLVESGYARFHRQGGDLGDCHIVRV